MAVALAVRARDVSSLRRIIADLTFSGTYTTGGEATTAGFLKDLSMSRIHMVHFNQVDGGVSAGLVAQYNPTTNKVQLYEGGAAVDSPQKEVTSAQSLAGVVMRAEFIGEGN